MFCRCVGVLRAYIQGWRSPYNDCNFSHHTESIAWCVVLLPGVFNTSAYRFITISIASIRSEKEDLRWRCFFLLSSIIKSLSIQEKKLISHAKRSFVAIDNNQTRCYFWHETQHFLTKFVIFGISFSAYEIGNMHACLCLRKCVRMWECVQYDYMIDFFLIWNLLKCYEIVYIAKMKRL